MNLDELANAIKEASPEPDAQRIADFLIAWKATPDTVEDLRSQTERYIGHVWLSTDSIHTYIYGLWTAFVSAEIEHIHGMTMNERLYAFGLFPQFEKATTPDQRLVIYEKLLASP